MDFPLVLSPYLRPILVEGEIVIDNGVTGRHVRLEALQLRVVRALWDPESVDEALGELSTEDGEGDVLGAIEALVESGMVFPDLECCDEVFDQLLEASRPTVPFVDQVELTNHCPMRCGFCPRGIPGGMTRAKGFMDLELFRRLLDQLHPTQRSYRPLELHHLGESLLHAEVHRFVELATERGLPTEMSVNPALLSPEKGRRLVEAGLGRLVVSLDGTDAATLEALRGPAARYERAEANLQRLLEVVAAHPRPPRVVIQMLDLDRNREQRQAFLERWGGTGLPTVTAYIKDLDGDDPDTGRPSGEPLVHLCTYPFRSVVVLWDGRVVPCCRDADASVVLGDVSKESLRSIWEGPTARQLREAHRTGHVPEGHLCVGCAWLRRSFAAQMSQRHPDRAKPDPLVW